MQGNLHNIDWRELILKEMEDPP